MDILQTTSLCILVIIAIGLVGLIIIIHKAVVRHQASADAQTHLLGRLIEVEIAIKSALPTMERNTGAAHQQLAESLPVIAKAVGDMSALLASRLPAFQESVSAMERVNAEVLRGIGETAKTLTTALALLDTLAKTHGDEAVGSRASTLHKAIATNSTALHKELGRVTAEVTALRKDLSEAVKF